MRLMSRRPPAHILLAVGAWLATPLATPLATSSPALAASVDAGAASDLERQVRDWLADLVGPSVNLGGRPVRFVAQDDHFRVEYPVDGQIGATGVTIDAGPMTALARPLEAGRWAIDDLRVPSPIKVTFGAPKGAGTMTQTTTLGEQVQHAVLDPTFATASNLDSTIRGYETISDQPSGTSRTSIDRIASHLTLQPTDSGRVDVLQQNDEDLIAVNTVNHDLGPVAFSAEHGHSIIHINGLAPTNVRPILQAAFQFGPMAAAAMQAATEQAKVGKANAKANAKAKAKAKPATAASGPDFTLTPVLRAALRAALVAMQDLSTGMDEQVTLENVHLQAAGFSGRAQKISMGMGIDAPDGKLALKMTYGLDGMDSPDLPAGVIREYLPRHFLLAPRVSGVPGADVMALLLRAVDTDGNDPGLQGQAEGLLGKGPIAVGFDELGVDFGPASLTGHGEMRIIGRDNYAGEAHLAATGLDAIIRRANTTPQLKEAAPILIFLKGIGQQDGETVVWDITYKDGQMLVNGTDMTQMMPHK